MDVERGVALAVGGVTEVRDELVCDSFVSLLFADGRTVIEVAWQAGHSPTMALATYGHPSRCGGRAASRSGIVTALGMDQVSRKETGMKDDARYNRRKKRLNDGLTRAKSPQLKAAYERADELTDAAVDAYLRLVEAADVQSAAYLEHADGITKSIVDERNQLIESAEATIERFRRGEIDAKALQAKRSSILVDVMTQQARVVTYSLMDDQQAQRLASVSQLGKSLWDKIIDIDDKDFSKEVAIKAIEAGIGLLPLAGSLYGVGKSMLDLASFHTSQIETTDKILLFLNSYAESLDAWCVAAETAIRRLDPTVF